MRHAILSHFGVAQGGGHVIDAIGKIDQKGLVAAEVHVTRDLDRAGTAISSRDSAPPLPPVATSGGVGRGHDPNGSGLVRGISPIQTRTGTGQGPPRSEAGDPPSLRVEAIGGSAGAETVVNRQPPAGDAQNSSSWRKATWVHTPSYYRVVRLECDVRMDARSVGSRDSASNRSWSRTIVAKSTLRRLWARSNYGDLSCCSPTAFPHMGALGAAYQPLLQHPFGLPRTITLRLLAHVAGQGYLKRLNMSREHTIGPAFCGESKRSR